MIYGDLNDYNKRLKRKSKYLSDLVLREFGVNSLICGLRIDPESGLGQVSGRIWD